MCGVCGLCCVLNEDKLPRLPVPISCINKVVGASDHVDMRLRLSRLPVPVENDTSRHIEITEMSPPHDNGTDGSVHPVMLISMRRQSTSESQTGSPPRDKVTTPVMSPCSVVLERFGSPDQSPPVRRKRTPARKWVAVIESEEEDVVPRPKRRTRPRSASGDRTNSGSEAWSDGEIDSDAEVPGLDEVSSKRKHLIDVTKDMEKHGFHMPGKLRKHMSEKEYIRCMENSMTSNYKLTIDNNCNDMIRDQNPLNFQLAHVASVDKLHELSVVLRNSQCSIATQLGYYRTLNYFLKAIKRSTKYQATHGHLMKKVKR